MSANRQSRVIHKPHDRRGKCSLRADYPLVSQAVKAADKMAIRKPLTVITTPPTINQPIAFVAAVDGFRAERKK